MYIKHCENHGLIANHICMLFVMLKIHLSKSKPNGKSFAYFFPSTAYQGICPHYWFNGSPLQQPCVITNKGEYCTPIYHCMNTWKSNVTGTWADATYLRYHVASVNVHSSHKTGSVHGNKYVFQHWRSDWLPKTTIVLLAVVLTI